MTIIDPVLPTYSKICTLCKHWNILKDRACAAFDEIPVEIWLGKNDHTKPYPGDKGIRFERIAESDKEKGV